MKDRQDSNDNVVMLWCPNSEDCKLIFVMKISSLTSCNQISNNMHKFIS